MVPTTYLHDKYDFSSLLPIQKVSSEYFTSATAQYHSLILQGKECHRTSLWLETLVLVYYL